MSPQKRFHLVFSFVMGAIMVFFMTFVVTAANIGFPQDFVLRWARAFAVAYSVAVPLIYFFVPLERRVTGRITGMP